MIKFTKTMQRSVNSPITKFVFIQLYCDISLFFHILFRAPFSSISCIVYIYIFSLSTTNEGIFQPLWIIITKNLISSPCYLKLVFSSIYTMCRNIRSISFISSPFILYNNKFQQPSRNPSEFSINIFIVSSDFLESTPE